ncbi:platelet-activating factor acetylhydrolase isoform X2 [Halyomorpha halys]|uniref:platelet-activating factor acetylhydrolase isoform X2 n=1 Tax=Halyomorpha halys TaxID=286706 RepID=UPI0006D4E3B1|nr:platelet-activating factor acetylhydrolase isoform X2 [Halyomorpha halys]
MWWSRGLLKHLPLSLGQYAPAFMDIMSDFTIDSTFIRLYYPSSTPNIENDATKWIKWSPNEYYLQSMADLVSNWGTVLKAVLWLYGGEPHVPAMWEAEPMQSISKIPVIIFSHGFGATRFLSSTIAIELASRGFIVASIEHKDSSACATYYYESPEKLEKDEKTWIPHEKMKFGPDHYKVRNTQLRGRANEIIKLIDFLHKINSGEASNILKSSVDLSSFKDRLELSSLSMMGHSFGGATSMLAMSLDDRIKYGIILDGWMFPLKEEDLVIKQPLIFINTQTFHIESNIKVIEKYLNSNPAGVSRDIYTIKHTTHESQTDTPHILGYWLNWFMPKLDPVVGTNINNHMILCFLHKNIGFPEFVTESENYLKKEAESFVTGTIIYAKMPKRKL